MHGRQEVCCQLFVCTSWSTASMRRYRRQISLHLLPEKEEVVTVALAGQIQRCGGRSIEHLSSYQLRKALCKYQCRFRFTEIPRVSFFLLILFYFGYRFKCCRPRVEMSDRFGSTNSAKLQRIGGMETGDRTVEFIGSSLGRRIILSIRELIPHPHQHCNSSQPSCTGTTASEAVWRLVLGATGQDTGAAAYYRPQIWIRARMHECGGLGHATGDCALKRETCQHPSRCLAGAFCLQIVSHGLGMSLRKTCHIEL